MGLMQFSNTGVNETVEYDTCNRTDLRSIMWVGKFLELIWRISQRPITFGYAKI